ncbi:DUF4388 domain-containing protein [Oscillatoria laete-virens NRMC-F 0139]|nr:DUF4388 domain-containing protein [Oscillatoria laete-virens]MDL5054851.1 DUF4388 domain-containing protein [Oscillatoria laete-virens NRMC-F 0139]
MLIGLAIQPATTADWIKLALSAVEGAEIIDVPGSFAFERKLDLLIFDDEKPGTGFMLFYQALMKKQGGCDKIVLGSPQSALMMTIEWNPEDAIFLSKPYQYEMIRQAVQLKSQKVSAEKAAVSLPATKAVSASGANEPRKFKLGYLSSLHLADLIQMLCMSNWSGKIEIINLATDETGTVYINVGVLIHAKTPTRSGEDACLEMLRWGRCSYDFSEEVTHVVQTIQSSYQSILLEGAKALDELEHQKNFGT